MGKLMAAITAAALAALLLVGAALPASRDTGGQALDVQEARWGSLANLPREGTLVIEDSTLAFTPDEVAQVRDFLTSGGKLLVVGISPAAATLVRDLDVALDARQSLVFDPDADARGAIPVTGTGILDVQGRYLVVPPHIVLGGQPLLVTGPFTWEDQDANGLPNIGEPRGSWPVATLQPVGAGAVMVLGSKELSRVELLGPTVAAWVQGRVVADGVHRVGTDAVGMDSLLAGRATAGMAGALVVLAVAGFGLAARAHVRKVVRRGRRNRGDLATLEILAELEG